MATSRKLNLIGVRFGKLMVKSEAVPLGRYRYRWNCLCDCGRTLAVDGKHLRSGATISCGCEGLKRRRAASTTHGLTPKGATHPLHTVWSKMRARCTNPDDPAYFLYGGRGIKVADEWNDFARFVADMMPRPFGTSLDRIDNDGPYASWNCRWARPQDQANNRRSSHFVEFNGRRLTIAQWGRETGIPARTIGERLRCCGWTVEEALTIPVQP